MSSISVPQPQCDRLYEILQTLKEWDSQIRYRPSNYVQELEGHRRALLTAARDLGQDVRVSVDCAVRERRNSGAFSAYTEQIRLIADRLGTLIDVLLREMFQSQPGSSEHSGLLLAMQVRVQALYLYITLESGTRIPLHKIVSSEYYQKYFGTEPDCRDIVAEHWAESADSDPTLYKRRIRTILRPEIPKFERTIQALSELVDSLPGSSLAPIVPNSGGSASPAAGANSTPFIEPAVENLGPGCGERDDLTRALSRHVVERTEVADREDESVDSPVIGGNPNSETTTCRDLTLTITVLRDTKRAVLCSLFHHGPMERKDILLRIRELDCDPEPGTLTNHLTQLSKKMGLIERVDSKTWRLAPNVDQCLKRRDGFPMRFTDFLDRANGDNVKSKGESSGGGDPEPAPTLTSDSIPS